MEKSVACPATTLEATAHHTRSLLHFIKKYTTDKNTSANRSRLPRSHLSVRSGSGQRENTKLIETSCFNTGIAQGGGTQVGAPPLALLPSSNALRPTRASPVVLARRDALLGAVT